MKKPTLIPFFDDLTNTKKYTEVICAFCDCCEEEIKEGTNIGTEEDFCYKCYESGGISRCLKNNFNFDSDEHYHTINLINDNYDKLKLLKII